MSHHHKIMYFESPITGDGFLVSIGEGKAELSHCDRCGTFDVTHRTLRESTNTVDKLCADCIKELKKGVPVHIEITKGEIDK